jgi:hypothetical protein
MTLECEHGQLARACTICYLEREIEGHEAVMRQALEALEAWKAAPALAGEDEWPILWKENGVTVNLLPPLLQSGGRATRLRSIELLDLGRKHNSAITALRTRLGTQPPADVEDRLARHGIPMPEEPTSRERLGEKA